MTSKVESRHLAKPVYIYVRQSTLAQVRHHQESTERQYALQNQARELGWAQPMIRILDRDLGLSGAQSSLRKDFKTLVADVSMGKVGAVMALEASRLARSNADWYRLIELCAATDTLIIDEDGCYSPADFNDGLLLGLKATMSQAELHLLRARLQGGRLNKAEKGELHTAQPAGLCYNDEGLIVFDPDAEVRGAVRLMFASFRQTGSAYGVVNHFAQRGHLFPTRVNGGVRGGTLKWGRLSHSRAIRALKNPSYAGAYVHGRYQRRREIDADGNFRSHVRELPISSWRVIITDHHEGYISWEEYLTIRAKLESNRFCGEEALLSRPAREGIALLQGLLICGVCGHRLNVVYAGSSGAYPRYLCRLRLREGLGKSCMNIRCDAADEAVSKRTLEVLEPARLELAAEALHELERRDEAAGRQWRMRIERAEYQAQLTQRRYEEVDPSNRLVAATLERQWNDALEHVEEVRKQYADFQRTQGRAITPEQRAKIVSLAEDLPRLWNAPTTQPKDKKRMLRLLIKDITVEKQDRKGLLHVRWQGGACEDIVVEPKAPCRRLYSNEFVEEIRELAANHPDTQIASILNEQGRTSARNKPFSASIIGAIRNGYGIDSPQPKPREYTVGEIAEKFGVSRSVVHHWKDRGLIKVSRFIRGSYYLLTLEPDQEDELYKRAGKSTSVHKGRRPPLHGQK
jgi:DNA invertase Pin-like site-specific DNA recombinase